MAGRLAGALRRAGLFAILGAVAAPGCGGPPADRFPVSGRVMLDGKPLGSGMITFLPSGEGPAVGAPIAEGAYRLGAVEGPAPGAHRVEIDAVEPTGRRVKDLDNPAISSEETRNIIPPAFNRQSRLVVEVEPGGANTFDFAVDSKPQRQQQQQKKQRR